MKITGRKPRGEELMALLIKLLAEQEGVEITYTLGGSHEH